MSYFTGGLIGTALAVGVIAGLVGLGFWIDRNLARSAASELMPLECYCSCDGETAVLEILPTEGLE